MHHFLGPRLRKARKNGRSQPVGTDAGKRLDSVFDHLSSGTGQEDPAPEGEDQRGAAEDAVHHIADQAAGPSRVAWTVEGAIRRVGQHQRDQRLSDAHSGFEHFGDFRF